MTSLPPASSPASEPQHEIERLSLTITDLEAERDALSGLLAVIAEALDIPAAATADDTQKRAAIVAERVQQTVVALRSVEVHHDIDWIADHLRQRLADHPPTGYEISRSAQMTETPAVRPRRMQLLDAIRADGGEVTTARATQLNAAAGFSGNRNTSRKDLRALTRRGDLVRLEDHGRHLYTLPSPDCGA